MNDQGKWKPAPCNRKLKFVCERQQPYVLSGCDMPFNHGKPWDHEYRYYPQVPPAQKMLCFFYHNGPEPTLTYPEAERFCAKSGGHVIMPKTQYQQTRIIGDKWIAPQEEPLGDPPWPLGDLDWWEDFFEDLFDLKETPVSPVKDIHFWIGADNLGYCYNQKEWCPTSPASFTYLDGDNLTFNGFRADEPNNMQSHTQGCIILSVKHRTWDDVRCHQRYPVLCQVEHSYIRAHVNWDWMTACIPNHTHGPQWYPAPGDVCYVTIKLSTNRGSGAMVDFIKQWLGDVNFARPHSREQMRALVMSTPGNVFTHSSANSGSTLGLQSTQFPVWKWLNIQNNTASWSKVWPYESNWAPGHPVRPAGVGYPKQCAEFLANGRWRSYPCTEGRVLSCESPAVASLSQWKPRPWARKRKGKLAEPEAATSDHPRGRPCYNVVVILLACVIYFYS